MKLAQALRKKKEAAEEPDSMLAEMFEFIVSPEFERNFNVRTNGCFHPSELYKGCRRRLAYEYLQAPTNDVNRDPRMQMIFEVGHGVHYRLQKMAKRLAERHGWTFNDEVKIRASDNHWYIGGSCDGIWYFANDPIPNLGLEIKTINKNDFNALVHQPKKEHIYQGNIYMGCLGIPKMAFWYMCKDNSQMKEFVVEFDQKLFEEQMAEVEDILLQLQKGKLPAKCKTDCVDPGCKYLNVCQKKNIGVKELASDETSKAIKTFRAKFLGSTVTRVPDFETCR